jgi:hypothetical protein
MNAPRSRLFAKLAATLAIAAGASGPLHAADAPPVPATVTPDPRDVVADKMGYKYVLTLDDVIASRGGIPLIEDGRIIGAIGCSGASGAQDAVVCTAGAVTINK